MLQMSNLRGRWGGYLSLTHCFSVASQDIAIFQMLPKTRSLGPHFSHKQYGTSFSHFDYDEVGHQSAAADFGEITQNNGRYAVQGHSRSPISVPMESLYATSYVWLTVTSVSHILHCFPDMANYWSNFRCRQDTSLYHTGTGWTDKFRTTKPLQNCRITYLFT